MSYIVSADIEPIILSHLSIEYDSEERAHINTMRAIPCVCTRLRQMFREKIRQWLEVWGPNPTQLSSLNIGVGIRYAWIAKEHITDSMITYECSDILTAALMWAKEKTVFDVIIEKIEAIILRNPPYRQFFIKQIGGGARFKEHVINRMTLKYCNSEGYCTGHVADNIAYMINSSGEFFVHDKIDVKPLLTLAVVYGYIALFDAIINRYKYTINPDIKIYSSDGQIVFQLPGCACCSRDLLIHLHMKYGIYSIEQLYDVVVRSNKIEPISILPMVKLMEYLEEHRMLVDVHRIMYHLRQNCKEVNRTESDQHMLSYIDRVIAYAIRHDMGVEHIGKMLFSVNPIYLKHLSVFDQALKYCDKSTIYLLLRPAFAPDIFDRSIVEYLINYSMIHEYDISDIVTDRLHSLDLELLIIKGNIDDIKYLFTLCQTYMDCIPYYLWTSLKNVIEKCETDHAFEDTFDYFLTVDARLHGFLTYKKEIAHILNKISRIKSYSRFCHFFEEDHFRPNKIDETIMLSKTIVDGNSVVFKRLMAIRDRMSELNLIP